MPALLGGDIRCPIARSLEVLGDRWSLMIVRDALLGRTRFSEFRESLGVPRDILTSRLATLVDGGVFDRVSYRADGERSRDEYVLSDAGRELMTVLGALGEWGDRHRPIEQRTLIHFVEETTGANVEPRFVTADGRVLEPAQVVATTR
jgi:DNA-binding HxlR family transcriptional regulator